MLDMVGERRTRVVLSASGDARGLPPHPPHRPVDVLGRAARAERSSATRASRRSSASTARRRRSSSSAPSSSRSPTRTRCIRRIVEAAEIDTVVDTRLVVDSIVTTPRLAHENNVIGTMNVLAACGGPDSPVRKVVFKSSAHYYGCEQDDPAFFTEAMTPPARRRAPRSSATSSRPSAPSREFAERNPDVTVTVLRFANGLGPDAADVAQPAVRPAGRARRSSASTRATSSSTRTTSSAASSTRSATTCPASTTCAADGVLVAERGRRPARQAARAGPAAVGDRRSPRRAAPRSGSASRPRCCGQLRFGRGLDNRKLKATGYRYRYTTRETVLKLREHQRLAADPRAARRPAPTATSARSRSSCAAARACRPTAPRLEARRRAARTPAPGAEAGARPRRSTISRRDEIIALLPSLDPAGLRALREHETAHAALAGR